MSDVLPENLTPEDYRAAGVEAPNWREDPIPSLETWRRWRAAESAALAWKLAAQVTKPA